MTEDKLKAALIQAHNKGDKEAAQLFASKIKELRGQSQPQQDAQGEPSLSMFSKPQQRPQQPEPSFADKAIGAGEAALTTVTGATAGTAGSLIGTLEGIVQAAIEGKIGEPEAAQIIQQRAAELGSYGTYQPRTQQGQEYVQTVAEVAGALPPTIAGVTGAQAAGMQQGLGRTAQLAAANIPTPQAKPQTMGGLSIGAAEVPAEVVQYQKFQELPVPVTPTMSDLAVGDSRFAWKQFENEIAKDEQLGKANREASALKNSQIQQNFEEFIDMTGTQLPETNYMLATGSNVVKALTEGRAADKAKISAAYKVAEKRGELEGLVPQDRLDGISTFINENRAKRTNAPVLQGFVDEAFVKEVGEGSLTDGTFRLKPLTINQAETLRKEVNRLTDQTNPQDLFYAGEIKKMIDDAQDGLGGQAFQTARKMAKQSFDKYKNNYIISELLASKKGKTDSRIPAEMVVQKAVLSGSVEDLNNFRRTLMKSGAEGMSAWRDVQAAVLRNIRDEAVKSKTNVDNAGLIKAQAGAINKAVSNLDKNGKLNLLFGKKNADQLRLLSEVSSRIAENMPGTFNASNNMAWISVMRKLPVVGTLTDITADAASLVKDRKARAKAQQSVNVEKTLKKQGIDLSKYNQEAQ